MLLLLDAMLILPGQGAFWCARTMIRSPRTERQRAHLFVSHGKQTTPKKGNEKRKIKLVRVLAIRLIKEM